MPIKRQRGAYHDDFQKAVRANCFGTGRSTCTTDVIAPLFGKAPPALCRVFLFITARVSHHDSSSSAGHRHAVTVIVVVIPILHGSVKRREAFRGKRVACCN